MPGAVQQEPAGSSVREERPAGRETGTATGGARGNTAPGTAGTARTDQPLQQQAEAGAGKAEARKAEAGGAAPSAQQPGSQTETVTGTPADAERPAAPAEQPPRFDIVRVDPEGQVVVAGRAAPGVRVEILSDDQVLAESVSGPDGSFVALFDLPPGTQPLALVLRAGGVTSPRTIIVTPPARAVASAPKSKAKGEAVTGGTMQVATNEEAGAARRPAASAAGEGSMSPAASAAGGASSPAAPGNAVPVTNDRSATAGATGRDRNMASAAPPSEGPAQPVASAGGAPAEGGSAAGNSGTRSPAGNAATQATAGPAPTSVPAAGEPAARRTAETATPAVKGKGGGEKATVGAASRSAGREEIASASPSPARRTTAATAGGGKGPSAVPETAVTPSAAGDRRVASAELADRSAETGGAGASRVGAGRRDETAPRPGAARPPASSAPAAVEPADRAASASPTERSAGPAPAAPPAGPAQGAAAGTQESPAATATVIAVGEKGVEVLQAGDRQRPSTRIAAITYDPEGEVVIAGIAPERARVRLKADARPIKEVLPEEGGRWQARLPELPPGTYDLSVEAVDESGRVVARDTTPFRKESPERVAEAKAAAAAQKSPPLVTVTVQPGNTLWGISRRHYGGGRFYVWIYDANADKIRDPDLIYPGQVFVIPDRRPLLREDALK